MKGDLRSGQTNSDIAFDQCAVGRRDRAGGTSVGRVTNGQTSTRGCTVYAEHRFGTGYSDTNILRLQGCGTEGKSQVAGYDNVRDRLHENKKFRNESCERSKARWRTAPPQ